MITFFDSNIFVYALDRAEPVKQPKALARIEQARAEGNVALSTQVLHEFYSICTRKLKPALTHASAAQAIHHLCEFVVLEHIADSRINRVSGLLPWNVATLLKSESVPLQESAGPCHLLRHWSRLIS